MGITRLGFLGAVARAAVLALCRVTGWAPPVRRALRGSRSLLMAVTTIESKGTVRLASGTDASAPPLIDPAYLSHPEDRRLALEGWRMIRRVQKATAAGQAFLGPEMSPGKK